MGIVGQIHLFSPSESTITGTEPVLYWVCMGLWLTKVFIQSISLFLFITFQARESLICHVLYLAIKSMSTQNKRRALVLSGAQKEEA